MKNPKHFHNNHALHSNKYDEIQDFTWIFRLLWSLLDAKEHNDVNNCDFGKHFKLNIPDTVIFSDGTPTIWLATKPNGKLSIKLKHVPITSCCYIVYCTYRNEVFIFDLQDLFIAKHFMKIMNQYQ